MIATKNMSDAELRNELKKLGFSPGPITDNTRGVLRKKLQKLKADSAKSQKASKESERTRKGDGSTRSRRSEPLEDEEGDWEDEEETWRGSKVSDRQSHRLETNSYGGSERSDRREGGRAFFHSATSHVEDKGLGRGDESSLASSYLSRGTGDYKDYLIYEHGPSLKEARLPRATSDYASLGQETRSYLGRESLPKATSNYASFGQETRSYLGGERLPKATSDYASLGQETRSYLGGERLPRATSDYGSLGQETRSFLGGERLLRATSDYGSLGQETRSPLRDERFTSNTSDSSGYLGQQIRSFLGGKRSSKNPSDSSLGQETRSSLGGDIFTSNPTDYNSYGRQELRSRSTGGSSWSSLPLNRDEGRRWSRYDERDTHSIQAAKDQLYYKNYPSLSQGKSAQRKPNWSRTLEYYLSKLVRALSVGLFVVFFGIFIVKSGIFYSTQQDDIKRIPADCESKHDEYCQAMQKQTILQVLSDLYNFLSLEAGSYECGNPSGLSSKCIPIKRAKAHVMDVYGHAEGRFDSALDWLLDRKEHFGIWAKGEDGEIATTSSLVFCVESSRPHLGITCRMTNALYTAISNLFLALFGVFVLWLFLIYLRYHWRKLEEGEKQMFAMVEKIIDVVKEHYKGYQQGIEQHPYIGILHVRDTLIMPQDRKRLKRVWDRAVQFVENNESRLRAESQRVAGADLQVWRWTQSRHEIPTERSSPSLSSTRY